MKSTTVNRLVLLTVAAAFLAVAVTPAATAQYGLLGFKAQASGSANCHPNDPSGLSWHASESASAKAWGPGTIVGVTYIAHVKGDHMPTRDDTTLYMGRSGQVPQASASSSWSGNVAIGTQVAAFAEATALLAGVPMAHDVGGGTDTCYF